MNLVTIITPLYNSEMYIESTIDSIVAQTYQNWELIIVDDCSSDNSVEIVESYCKMDSRIKLIKLENNSGAAVARNTAIENANGRFIAFLDSDDKWSSIKLENQLKFMLKHDYAFTYTHYHQINENGETIGNLFFPDKIDYNSLLKTCVIGCLTVMYDTSKLGKVYFPLIRKRQDFALWLKILKRVEFAYCVPEDLASYTIRSDSISSNKFKAAQYNWYLYNKIEKLGLIRSLYYFSNYIFRGIIRSKFKILARMMHI